MPARSIRVSGMRWVGRILFAGILTAVGVAAGVSYSLFNLVPASSATNVPPQPEPTVQIVHGESVVAMAPDVQQAAGIVTEALAQTTIRAGRISYATVVDPQQLFDVTYRKAAAEAEVKSAEATAEASRIEYERDQALMKDSRSITEKELQDAIAAMQTDRAKLEAAKVAATGLDASVKLQFGATVAQAMSSESFGSLGEILKGRSALLLVTLPSSYPRPAPEEIDVGSTSGESFPARRISASPKSDAIAFGEPYFYLAPRTLSAGARLIARIPTSDDIKTGVRIPDAAVLWYAGQRWVYVRLAPDRFARRAIKAPDQYDPTSVETTDFKPDEQVVTQGAQLLLAEELRPQGITTQCKDPPECDD